MSRNGLVGSDGPGFRTGLSPIRKLICAAIRLTAKFGKFEKKMEHLLSEQTKATEQLLADQADIILEAVDERMDKKLDEKLDPFITKMDAVLKKFEDHRDEDVAGAEQLRRHDD